VAWKLASLVINQALRLVTLVVLARALSPQEFGLAAMALAVWSAVNVFTDLALAAALIQRPEIDERDRSTAFWAGSLSGLILALAGLAASGAVAAFFDEPDVQWLFAALGLGAFVASLASTHIALLTRAMDFRTLELISMSATFTGAVAGVGLAFAGAGAWAIVVSSLVTSLVTCALAWRLSAWRPQLLFSRESLRRLAGFASLLSATRLVVAVQRTADRLLIGRFLGAPALGVYTVPASIVFLPAARLVDPIRSVLFPAFSKLQRSPSELAEAWLRVTRLVCTLLAPVLLLLAAAADEIVAIALTSRWSEAAPVLRILALAGLFQLAAAMNAVVLTALGRLSTVLRVFCLSAALSVVGFAIGRSHGLEGAAAGYAAGTVAVAPYYVYLTARALELRARDVATAYLAPAAGLLAMGVGIAGVELVGGESTEALRLAAVTVIGLGLYVLVVLGSFRAVRSDLRAVVGRAPARTPL
jgi:O-antigen/teichoic acid export membrane protein